MEPQSPVNQATKHQAPLTQESEKTLTLLSVRPSQAYAGKCHISLLIYLILNSR